MTATYSIRRLSAGQTAKVMGALYFLFGIIFAVIFGFFGLVSSAFMPADDRAAFMFGGAFIVLMPILYGVMGLVSGWLIALLYNMVAGITGGLEMELTSGD